MTTTPEVSESSPVTALDELATVIHRRICEDSLSECLEDGGYCVKASREILADGYRKPRTITTIEELEALPHGSVIRSSHRHYWVAHKEDGEGGNQGWAAAGTSRIPTDLAGWLPATVLHEGDK